MSERIDGSVLDRLLWAITPRPTRDYRTVTLGEHECRAVAELVDAANALVNVDDRMTGEPGKDAGIWLEADARLRTALARIAPAELHDKAAELRGRGE